MLWINEGFVLDDAGNMALTSYIDLRGEGDRTAIRSLVLRLGNTLTKMRRNFLPSAALLFLAW